ncbi:hypothetical protein BJX62DRAFT_26138 [Aspergillus germanicus]
MAKSVWLNQIDLKFISHVPKRSTSILIEKQDTSSLTHLVDGYTMMLYATQRGDGSFNVPEMKRLAAQSVQHCEEDVVSLVKLAEGGFNRSVLITLRSGLQVVARIPYPVTQPLSEEESAEYLRLDHAQGEAEEQLQTCQDFVGVGREGWVPDEVKQREVKLKADALEAAESEEERTRLEESWIFDDFEEDNYM